MVWRGNDNVFNFILLPSMNGVRRLRCMSIQHTCVTVHLLQCCNCFQCLACLVFKCFKVVYRFCFLFFCQLFFEFRILWIIQNSNAKYCSQKNDWTIQICLYCRAIIMFVVECWTLKFDAFWSWRLCEYQVPSV